MNSRQEKIKRWGKKYEQATRSQRVGILRKDIHAARDAGFRIQWDEPLSFRRAIAYVIDIVVAIVPFIVIIIPLVSYREALWPSVFVGFAWIPTYMFLRDGWQGAGVGKRIIGLRVIDRVSGKPITYKQSFLRYPLFFRFELQGVVLHVALSGITSYRQQTQVIKKKYQ